MVSGIRSVLSSVLIRSVLVSELRSNLVMCSSVNPFGLRTKADELFY